VPAQQTQKPQRGSNPKGAPVATEAAEGAVRLMHLQAQAAGREEGGAPGSSRFRSVGAPWWRTWSWLLLTVVALTGFVLGVIGGRGGFGSRVEDALALFPSGFPSASSRAGRSTTFVVAMYLAPVVALWVTASVVVALYARHWNEFRARRRRDHAIVCGLGEKGLRSARALLSEGFKVTGIDLNGTSDAAVDIRARGATVLVGDATQMHLLETARADRAAVVVCACLEDSANASIASQVERLARKRDGLPVDVYVHLANPDLSEILRAPTFGLDKIRLHFFNVYDLWAQALSGEAELDRLARDPNLRPHIVVVGSTGLARSLVIATAQRWYRLCPDKGRKIRITLIAADATAEKTALSRRYPAVPRTVDFVAVDHAAGATNPIDPAVIEAAATDFETTVYLCLFNDAENLSLALQVQHHVPEGSHVVVPASAWTSQLASLLLRTDDTIRAVGYTDAPDSLDVLRDSRRERMAREVHANYRASGHASVEADVDWRQLPEALRESNRLQVDAIDNHLQALWYEIVPLFEWDRPPAVLPEIDIELLAQLEHSRWCEEKRRNGYVHGRERQDEASPPTHPDLLPWAELPEAVREKDRNAACSWTGILSDAGYAIQRSPRREQLARAIHERHRSDRAIAGETSDGNSLLSPWPQLTEAQRDLSRSSADHIALKLAKIGCTVTPAPPTSPVLTLTEAEIEQLAQLEHERWCDERLRGGWRQATARDDDAKTHPDIVSWSILPEERRQIDRDHVQAIPELLASVGLRIVHNPSTHGHV
jgi:voltage-gated potassium channel Kch